MAVAQIISHTEIVMMISGERELFNHEAALAVLLHAKVLFCNTGKFLDKSTVVLFVNCNDLFAWACADAESVTRTEIQAVYEHWRKDKKHGTDIWCIKKRNQMPQKPVEDSIRKAGVWDLDAMNLPSNTMDARVQEGFKRLPAIQ